MKKINMKKSSELKKALGLALVLSAGLGWGHAANLAVVGNGASSGPIITTSAFGDIALGTHTAIIAQGHCVQGACGVALEYTTIWIYIKPGSCANVGLIHRSGC